MEMCFVSCFLEIDVFYFLMLRHLTLGPKPFNFFNYWHDHKDFVRWVEEAWDIEVSGTPMFKLYQKLKATKVKLKTVNKDSFGGITQRVKMARGKLENFQRKMLQSSSCL